MVVVPIHVDGAGGVVLKRQILVVVMVVVCWIVWSVPVSGGLGVPPVRPLLLVAPGFVWVVVLRSCCAVAMSVVFVSALLWHEWWLVRSWNGCGGAPSEQELACSWSV